MSIRLYVISLQLLMPQTPKQIYYQATFQNVIKKKICSERDYSLLP